MKREKFLWPLTGEHHEALMLCRKIRQALEAIQGDGSGSPLEGLASQVAAFFKEKLKPHFTAEEKMAEILARRLGSQNDDLQQLWDDHQRLEKQAREGSLDSLAQFAENLEAHVRFEENRFFALVEQTLTEQEKQEAARNMAETLASCAKPQPEKQKGGSK